MLTMLLGGLWHGAQWTFVAWGGYQGALLCLERLAGVSPQRDATAGIAKAALKILATFALVCLGWVLFRGQHFSLAVTVYRALFSGGPGASLLEGWVAILSAGIVVFGVVRFIYSRRGTGPQWTEFPPLAQAGALGAILFALELFSRPGAGPPFIYFKF